MCCTYTIRSWDVLAMFTVTITHAFYMKQLHCEAPFRPVVWHDWTVSADSTNDTQSCSCQHEKLCAVYHSEHLCTIQQWLHKHVAIHSCMEVPSIRYSLWVIMRSLRYHQVILYEYHHSTKLYWKISWVCCCLYCYKRVARVTMLTTKSWYLFWYSLVLWW